MGCRTVADSVSVSADDQSIYRRHLHCLGKVSGRRKAGVGLCCLGRTRVDRNQSRNLHHLQPVTDSDSIQAVLVASEPLSETNQWDAIPTNHALLIRPGFEVEIVDIGNQS